MQHPSHIAVVLNLRIEVTGIGTHAFIALALALVLLVLLLGRQAMSLEQRIDFSWSENLVFGLAV